MTISLARARSGKLHLTDSAQNIEVNLLGTRLVELVQEIRAEERIDHVLGLILHAATGLWNLVIGPVALLGMTDDRGHEILRRGIVEHVGGSRLDQRSQVLVVIVERQVHGIVRLH